MQGHSEEQNPNRQTLTTHHSTTQTDDSDGTEQVEFIDSIELARR